MDSSQHSVSLPYPDEYVQVGVITGSHGYDGRLRIQRDTDNPRRFQPGVELWIGGRPLKVQHTGGAGETVLVKLAGVDTREDAAALLREPVFVPRSAVASLPEDTYYHYELIGMTVNASSGEELGTLTEVITTGANDVYVVTTEDRELLVPAIGDVVREVDVGAGRMRVEVPEGLEWRQLKVSGPQRKKPPRRRRRKPPPQAAPGDG